MDKEKITQKGNMTYVIDFHYGNQKIEELILAYLTEKVREEIFEKERVSG
jgi:hypothetical protein